MKSEHNPHWSAMEICKYGLLYSVGSVFLLHDIEMKRTFSPFEIVLYRHTQRANRCVRYLTEEW